MKTLKGRPKEDVKVNFWKYVNKKADDECWEWMGSKSIQGYGKFSINRKSIRSHRASWILNVGEIPVGLFVCHHCDNRLCVNPNHLFLGTQKDNFDDMIRKGRRLLYGENNPRAILTEAIVIEIRKLHKNGQMPKEIAKIFGVPRYLVYQVVYNVTWKYLESI